jgi:hypothetical protein
MAKVELRLSHLGRENRRSWDGRGSVGNDPSLHRPG